MHTWTPIGWFFSRSVRARRTTRPSTSAPAPRCRARDRRPAAWSPGSAPRRRSLRDLPPPPDRVWDRHRGGGRPPADPTLPAVPACRRPGASAGRPPRWSADWPRRSWPSRRAAAAVTASAGDRRRRRRDPGWPATGADTDAGGGGERALAACGARRRRRRATPGCLAGDGQLQLHVSGICRCSPGYYEVWLHRPDDSGDVPDRHAGRRPGRRAAAARRTSTCTSTGWSTSPPSTTTATRPTPATAC